MLLKEELVIAFPKPLNLFRLAGVRRLKDPDKESKYFSPHQPWQKTLLSPHTQRIGHWLLYQQRAYRVAFDENLAIYVDYDFPLTQHRDWFEILYGDEALPRPDPYDLFLFLKTYYPRYPYFDSFYFIQSSKWIQHAINRQLFPYYWDAFASHEQQLLCEWLLSKDFRSPDMTSSPNSSDNSPTPTSSISTTSPRLAS